MVKLLLVEDEVDLLTSLSENLRRAGFLVDTCQDGQVGEEMAVTGTYDLIILDVNLPQLNGFEILKSVRQSNQEVKIIMLTARDSVHDRVQGLDLGANDYLLKPFYFEELEARIRSLIRRKTVQEGTVLKAGRLTFDTVSKIVKMGDQEIKLTGRERGILEYLLLHKGQYISQEALLDHVWESEVDAFSNAVRVHMSALRRKLKEVAGENLIYNEVGKGYRIED